MRIDDDQLKELFRGYAASRKPLTRNECPSPEVLASSFEPSASVRKKKKVVDHISGCSFCREEFMMLFEIQKREPSRLGVLSQGRSSRYPLWQYACVLLGLGLVMTSFFVSVHQKELSSVERSAERGITLLGPKADQSLSGSFVFRWRGRSASDYYILELFDDALLPIWTSGKIQELQIPIPPEVYTTLRPGRSYFWMVTAFSQGAKTEESHLGRFIFHR
ncbi:MAG: hypothetical protein WCC00_14345 [Candidatus Aminicenantales bacterium]